jgi:hypothetical protein
MPVPSPRRAVPSGPPAPDPRLQRIERLGYLLDNAIRIPGIGYRIGYDALIGLIPGVGDVAGIALSAYIIVEAARLGAPPAKLLRMAFNVGLEALVGGIPLLGDLFDATWKANARNLDLLHAHFQGRKPKHSDRRFVLGAVLVLLLVLAGVSVLLFYLLKALAGWLGL